MQPAGSNKSIPLVNSRIIAQAFAMRRVVQTPRVQGHEPIIRGGLAYGSALRDRRGQWRMWYLADPVYCEYFAASRDGRRWTFPRLDLVAPKIRPLLAGPNAFLCRQQKDTKGRWLVGTSGP